MIIHEMEQGTPEWLEVRKGKMTASNAQAIGNNGKGLKTYIKKITAQKTLNGKDEFSNGHTERGHELEEQARSLYELETEQTVKQVGFIEHSEYIGCSPDGLVGEDGGLEVKCLDYLAFFEHLLERENAIDSKYIWQIQMNLLITGRKWWDYLAYYPDYKKPLFIYRFEPDKEKIEKLKEGLKNGEQMIKDIEELINNKDI